MRSPTLLALALVACAALAAPAGAAVPHIVAPGETLWGIAAANGLTTHSLAAYNGLSEGSNVVSGATVQIPSGPEAAGANTPTTPAAPTAMGGYTIQPGDTLSDLAARSGVSVEQMAAMNGLSSRGPIIAGTALKLPTGSPVASTSGSTSTADVPAAPAAAPQPTSTTLDSGTIGSIASQSGVPSSLASAVAWQESGFNNGAVSSAGARGVMQVMPGTWNWVERNLSGPLDPSSATDNVRAGSLYLGRLLQDTGGDVRTAVAGYYQGLDSVQRDGMFSDTQRYVDDVLALQGRFGG